MNYSNLDPRYVWAVDIETADNDTASEFHKKFAKDIKAPKTWKDEEKIKAYIETKMSELGEKNALSWLTGKVVSIAAVNVLDTVNGTKEKKVIAFTGMNEKGILEAFAKEMSDTTNGIFQLVGKNSATFDFPFLKGRMMVHGISIPAEMMNSYNLLDIDKMICSYGQTSQTASLDKYAFALGIDGKTMSGGHVPLMYANAVAAKVTGDNDEYAKIMNEIKEYNIHDSVITAHIAHKLLKQG